MILFLAGTGLFLAGGVVSLFVRPTWKGPVFAGAAAAAQAFLLPPVFKVLLDGGPLTAALVFSPPIGRAVFRLDPLAAFFSLIVALGGLLAAVYSTGYMKVDREARSPFSYFYFFMGLLTAAMLLVVVAQNAVLFLVVWEIMSLASFFLVSTENAKEETRRAGIYYLWPCK
jgi:hydrogenase-4 component B